MKFSSKSASDLNFALSFFFDIQYVRLPKSVPPFWTEASEDGALLLGCTNLMPHYKTQVSNYLSTLYLRFIVTMHMKTLKYHIPTYSQDKVRNFTFLCS